MRPLDKGRIAARVSLLLVTIAAHALFAWPSRLGALDGFPLDDAWIHQVVARTFATSGTLGYAPGMHGAGATSYLWAALLAVNFKWLHVSPVGFTLVINVVLAALAVQLLWTLVADMTPRTHRRAHLIATTATTAVAACCANFVWFTFSGMEATLIVVLSLAAVVAWTRPGPRWAWGAGAAAAALALARPECIALGPLLALSVRWVRRPRRALLALLTPYALAVCVYVISNWVLAGSALPATLGGRRWLWADTSVGLTRFDLAAEFVAQWLQRLREYTLGTSASILLWLAFGVALFALTDPRVRRARGLVLVALWSTAQTAFYLVLLPTPGHGGRYQPLLPLLFALAMGLGARAACFGVLARIGAVNLAQLRRRVVIAVGATLAACVGWMVVLRVALTDFGHDHARAVSHVRATEQAAGLAIRALPPGAKVASFDIGGTGFFADRPVQDLGGLSDAATVSHLRDGSIGESLRAQAIDYVVLPVAYGDGPDPVHFARRLRLIDNPALRLQPLRVFSSPPEIWLPGARAVQHSSPRQILYQITYTDTPGPAPLTDRAAIDEPVLAYPAHERAVAQLRHGLALLAGAGVHVHVEVYASAPQPAYRDPNQWVVIVAQDEVSVQPPAGSSIDPAVATAAVAARALPYLEERDGGGLLRLIPWSIAELIRVHEDPRFLPPLPSVEPPRVGSNRPRAAATLAWGLPLALALVLVLLAATRRRALPRRFVLALTLVGCAPSAAPEDGPEVLARALEARPELADAFVAKGQRPLHWAAEHDDEETAAVLLAHGAAVDAADAEGRSALCVAARYDAPHVVSLLLDRQADVDASCDAFGDRPLHVAARYASAPLVQQLLRRANVDVTNHWGATALHAVALRRDESDGALMALLAAKPSLEVMDRRGFTALHAAVVRDRARTVELLMDAGAEPNVRSRTGETPYQLALASQADAVATRLVERGAGGVEEPPLFVAARTDDLPRLLALLPYAHIDGVHAGQTALQLAEACHSERAAAALRAHRWSAR